jgi:uncharacterized protein (TIGR02466 family)
MNVESLFSVPIGYTFLEDIDIDDLIEYGQDNLRPDGQSNPIYCFDEEPLKSLAERVTEEVNKVHKECGFKHSQKLSSIWFNESHPLPICKPHTHPQSFFVAIFYLTNPKNDSGNLTLLNPNNANDHLIPDAVIEEYNSYNRNYTIIPPAEKLLLVHPAWITHWVSQESSEEDRKSIAFNFVLDIPKSDNELHRHWRDSL